MKRLSHNDRKAWMEKTERLNVSRSIQVGDQVKDLLLRPGTVVRIDLPQGGDPIEDHGTIEVELDDGELEHYTHTAWTRQLRHL